MEAERIARIMIVSVVDIRLILFSWMNALDLRKMRITYLRMFK